MNEQEIFERAIKQIELGIARPISARGASALKQAIHEAYRHRCYEKHKDWNDAVIEKQTAQEIFKELDELKLDLYLPNEKERTYDTIKKKYLKE